jgi:hypothetical protein
MEVAAYVFDDEPPPPELSRALNYQSWGVVDIMNLPAGLLAKMNLCLNYYRALRMYKEAAASTGTVEFTKQHPHEWDLVTRVLNMRRNRGGE